MGPPWAPWAPQFFPRAPPPRPLSEMVKKTLDLRYQAQVGLKQLELEILNEKVFLTISENFAKTSEKLWGPRGSLGIDFEKIDCKKVDLFHGKINMLIINLSWIP